MFQNNRPQQNQQLLIDSIAKQTSGQDLIPKNFVFLRESTGTTYQFLHDPNLIVKDLINKIYGNRRESSENDENDVDLRYKGQILDRQKKLGEIPGIKQNPIIHIVFQQRQREEKNQINWVYISYSSQLGRMHFPSANPTVDDIIKKVEEMGIPEKQQILVFQSLRLEKGKNLQGYGIKTGDIISLGKRILTPTPIPVFNFNQQSKEEENVKVSQDQKQVEESEKSRENRAKITYLKPRMMRRNSDLKYEGSTSESLKIFPNYPWTPEPIPHRFNSKKLLKSDNLDQQDSLFWFNPSDFIQARTPNSPVDPYNFTNFDGFIMPTEQNAEGNSENQDQTSQKQESQKINIIFDEIDVKQESDKEGDQQEDIFKKLRIKQHQPIESLYYSKFCPNGEIRESKYENSNEKIKQESEESDQIHTSINKKKADPKQGELYFNLQSAFQKQQVIMCESANYEQLIKLQKKEKKQEYCNEQQIEAENSSKEGSC